MRRLGRAAAVFVACLLQPGGPASAQGTELPWGQSSDMIAWQTLAQIMAPSGNPSTHRVEFETWASDQDVYQTSPPVWPAPDAPKVLQASSLGSIHGAAGLRGFAVTGGQCQPPPDGQAGRFPAGACIGEEVRRNWASYQYIVSNGLYSRAGLANAFKARLKVDMPADAVEFKGDWVRVKDLITWISRSEGIALDEAAVRRTYYVSRVLEGRTLTDYALVSIHFSTKQIKNWVWADFEHKLNPGRCDLIGCHDSFGAVDKDVPPGPVINQNYGECPKSPKLLSLLKNAGIDPVWQNYCLKGSEVTFVDPDGTPTVLGDSVIERMDAKVPVNGSSCTTCHAYASFDRNGDPGLLDFIALSHPVGRPDPDKMKGLLHNDFIWGIAKMPPK